MYDDSFKLRYSYAPVAVSVSNSFNPTSEHIHNEIEILYIEKGTSVIKIGNSLYNAQAGDIFFVNPLEAHSIAVNNDMPYFHKCICFDTELITDKNIKSSIEKGEILIPHRFEGGKEGTGNFTENFLRLFGAVEKSKPSLMLESTAYIALMFLYLVDNSLLIKKYESKKERNFSLKAIKYIAENYSQKISSKDIAETMFYTQNYFCRAFKRYFGVSFSDYLNMYRVLKAKEKLLCGASAIAEIAEECGFESQAYFARIFKKHIGMSASKFQKVNTVQKTG